MGEVSKSAEEARERGFLKAADLVVFHPAELLHVAKQQARALAESGVRPALAPAQIPVAGATGIATLKMMLVNMKEGGFISEHDYEISSRIAEVLCGGFVEPGSMVDENTLTSRAFTSAELAKMLKTQERIEAMLKSGTLRLRSQMTKQIQDALSSPLSALLSARAPRGMFAIHAPTTCAHCCGRDRAVPARRPRHRRRDRRPRDAGSRGE